MSLPFETISSFEKAVICNSLNTDVNLHQCTPTTFLFSTLLELRRHKIKCNCKSCVSKACKAMDLIKTIPQITSPRMIVKETDDALFGSIPFHEGWEICVKIFDIITTCHSTFNDLQNQRQVHDFDKLTACFTTKIDIQSKTNSLASETFSDLWKNDWKDPDTSDDDFPSLG